MENSLPHNPQPQFIQETQAVSSTSSNSLKMVVVVLLILLPMAAVSGYYLGTNTPKNNTSSDNPIVKVSPSPDQSVVCTLDAKICPDGSSVGRVGPNCEFEQCSEAQEDVSTEQAILKGYYKKYDGTKWEWGNEEVMCDGLVTMGGNDDLITEFRSNAESGNTLNKIIGNDFLINIDFSMLSSGERILIEQSSASKPIELTVSKRNERGGGASTCHSLVDIISVRSL